MSPTSELAMADEAHARPLVGSLPGHLKPVGLRAVRRHRHSGHDFDDRELYERMHRECRRIYTRAFGAISDRDWDEAFNFAYGQAWKVERDKGPIDRLAAWLTTAAHNAVVSEHRKTARVDLLATEELLTEQALTDLAETVDDRQILRDAIFCLKTSLPERVRLVWTMRFAGDYEPREIQKRLQISRKAYEKDLEMGSRLVVSRLEAVRKSGACETPDMASMVRAYAIWGDEHGAERAALAREHLEQCPACRQTVRALRAAQRAAAFLPPPILGLTVHHWPSLGVVLQGTQDLAGRIQDGLWRITERVQDGLLRMKLFLINLVSRAPTSAPVNADRTATVLGASSTGGAALATKAVIGCLAAGILASGTSACLKAAGVGVPGLGNLIHSITDSLHHRAHESPDSYHVSIGPTGGFDVTPSSSALQSAVAGQLRVSEPAMRPSHVAAKSVHHSLSSAVAAHSEFGARESTTPQPSQADVGAARNEFMPATSDAAHAASSSGVVPTQEASSSRPQTSKASTSAAAAEFEGP